MLLAEVAPMSSTHNPSSEFNRRETSPMPLDRRVSFCGTAGVAVWFEELRKNFIRLSETDAIRSIGARFPTQTPWRLLSEYRPSLSETRPLQFTLNHYGFRGDVGLHISVGANRQAVVAQLNFAFDVAIHVQIF